MQLKTNNTLVDNKGDSIHESNNIFKKAAIPSLYAFFSISVTKHYATTTDLWSSVTFAPYMSWTAFYRSGMESSKLATLITEVLSCVCILNILLKTGQKM